MIPRGVRSRDMVGMEVRTTRAIKNGEGICVPKGAVVKIADFGRCFSIRTEECSYCGLSAYIRGITRDDVELIDKTDKKFTNADRIRNMTNEELGDFLDNVENAGYNDSSITPKDANNNHIDMLEWLTSEYDADKIFPG